MPAIRPRPPGTALLPMLVCVGAFGLAATSWAGPHIRAIDAVQLLELLQGLGYPTPYIDDKGDVVASMHGYRVFLFLEPDDSNLMLMAAFKAEGVEVNEINAWNRKRRFAMAFLDENGNTALQSDLDVSGGITYDTIREFVMRFESNLRHFLVDVVER